MLRARRDAHTYLHTPAPPRPFIFHVSLSLSRQGPRAGADETLSACRVSSRDTSASPASGLLSDDEALEISFGENGLAFQAVSGGSGAGGKCRVVIAHIAGLQRSHLEMGAGGRAVVIGAGGAAAEGSGAGGAGGGGGGAAAAAAEAAEERSSGKGRGLDVDVGLCVAEARLRQLVAAGGRCSSRGGGGGGSGGDGYTASLGLLGRIICEGVRRERACAAVKGRPDERSSRKVRQAWRKGEQAR